MLYVAIGRNIGEVPMSDFMWQKFQDLVVHAITDNEWVALDTRTLGQSHYGDMSEDTAVFVWFDKNSDLGQDTKNELGEIARQFEQESIAYSVSVTNFIEGVGE